MDESMYSDQGDNKKKIIIVVLVFVVLVGITFATAVVLKSRRGDAVATPAVQDVQTIPISDNGTAEDTGGAQEPSVLLDPETVCGDFTCQERETTLSCPQDCILATQKELQKHVGLRVLDSNTVQIEWITNVPTSGIVEYGHTDSYELGTVTDETLSRFSKAALVGLGDNEEVLYYRITVRDEGGNEVIIPMIESMNEIRGAFR